jgi:hypothetical protein
VVVALVEPLGRFNALVLACVAPSAPPPRERAQTTQRKHEYEPADERNLQPKWWMNRFAPSEASRNGNLAYMGQR